VPSNAARLPLLAIAAVFLGCLLAAPAGGVVGGTPANPEDYPWFTDIGSCGGMLVAPDRVLTAGHCVAGRPLDSLGAASFGGRYYKPVGFAMHPGWRKANGDNGLEDVALVVLDHPVAGVSPVALSGPSGPAMTIIGRGRVFAPGTGHGEGESFGSGLRQAQLRPIPDTECARKFRRARGNGGERFDAKRIGAVGRRHLRHAARRPPAHVRRDRLHEPPDADRVLLAAPGRPPRQADRSCQGLQGAQGRRRPPDRVRHHGDRRRRLLRRGGRTEVDRARRALRAEG
jgi:hypothetical protein